MKERRIPDETIHRLPSYLRTLYELSDKKAARVSSSEIAEASGIIASQVRKDFSYFGAFGRRGVGYEVVSLIGQIKRILKLDVVRKAALIGAGNLGSAVLSYGGFSAYSFEIAAAFDCDERKIGRKIGSVIIEDVKNIGKLRRRGIDIAILAIPAENAQAIVNKLVKAGVKAILNFSPCYLSVPEGIKVLTLDIAIYLARLPYYVPEYE